MGLNLDMNKEWDGELPKRMEGLLQSLLDKAGEIEGMSEGEVALTLVDDEAIRTLNRDYRGIDRATDVLSFALNETTGDEIEIVYDLDDEGAPDYALLGDIVISVPKAIAQSQEYGHSLEREIGFLFVHGFLHLLGYDHQDEEAEKAMFARQELVLTEVGLTR